MTYPPAKFDVDWSKETQVIVKKKLMFHLKPLFLASWQGFYSPIDPKNNPHLCLDMIYPPAKFDVDWSKETQVIVKKLMFDARTPNHWHPHSNNQVSPCENLVNKWTLFQAQLHMYIFKIRTLT